MTFAWCELRRARLLPLLIRRWQVIPAFKVDLTGFDAVWSLRKAMKPIIDGPLDLHAQFSEYITGNTVVALSTVFSRRWKHLHFELPRIGLTLRLQHRPSASARRNTLHLRRCRQSQPVRTESHLEQTLNPEQNPKPPEREAKQL